MKSYVHSLTVLSRERNDVAQANCYGIGEYFVRNKLHNTQSRYGIYLGTVSVRYLGTVSVRYVWYRYHTCTITS